jgi:hypothetical protein
MGEAPAAERHGAIASNKKRVLNLKGGWTQAMRFVRRISGESCRDAAIERIHGNGDWS